jgi:GDPmannose 4,6-dehydratase
MANDKTALITGITGQDGAYLSQLLLQKGYTVYGTVRNLNAINTTGLRYLNIETQVQFESVDLENQAAVKALVQRIKPSHIYHLAAQSSVSRSFGVPSETLSFNILSTLNLLEAIRLESPDTRFYQASSSEMYGQVAHLPVTEQSVLHPLSPYAISKATAHWTTINYREAYGLFTCCGVLFNHDSYLRPESFFTKKVIKTAFDIQAGKCDVLEVGNVTVKRDFGYAPSYVEAMMLMMEHESADDYLICSGVSIYLHEIVSHVFERLNIPQDRMVVNPAFYRPTDIQDMYGVPYKAKSKLGWVYELSYFDVLDRLIAEELASSN